MASKHNLNEMAGWRQAVAEAFATIYDAEARGSSLNSALASAGILVKEIKSNATGITVELPTVDADANIPAGFKRSDLTAEKLAALDAEALQNSKREVYSFITRKHRCGYWTTDQAVRVLDMLDMPQRPQTKTEVEATIVTGRSIPDRYGDTYAETQRVCFTLDGEHSRDDIAAKLDELFPNNSEANKVRQAFGLDPEPSQHSVYVSTHVTWPSFNGE